MSWQSFQQNGKFKRQELPQDFERDKPILLPNRQPGVHTASKKPVRSIKFEPTLFLSHCNRCFPWTENPQISHSFSLPNGTKGNWMKWRRNWRLFAHLWTSTHQLAIKGTWKRSKSHIIFGKIVPFFFSGAQKRTGIKTLHHWFKSIWTTTKRCNPHLALKTLPRPSPSWSF